MGDTCEPWSQCGADKWHSMMKHKICWDKIKPQQIFFFFFFKQIWTRRMSLYWINIMHQYLFESDAQSPEALLSHLWTTTLDISCDHDTLKEQPSSGKKLKKWLWQLFSMHATHPIGNNLSLSTGFCQWGQKQGRRTFPSSKANECHLNKESEMAWWCQDPHQTQPWASCLR